MIDAHSIADLPVKPDSMVDSKIDGTPSGVNGSLSLTANGDTSMNGSQEGAVDITPPLPELKAESAAPTTSSNRLDSHEPSKTEVSSPALPGAAPASSELPDNSTETNISLKNAQSDSPAPTAGNEQVRTQASANENQAKAEDKDHHAGPSPPMSPPATAPAEDSTFFRPPPTSTPPALSPNQDQTMADAPPLSPAKVPRERDEDEFDEPLAKRTKTADVGASQSEFKVPEVPSTGTQPESTSAPLTPLQTKFLIRTVTTVKRTHDARFFKLPVDYVKLNIPSYPTIITHPMDLHTMEDKLKRGEYKTLTEVNADIKLMVDNSITFNGREHIVAVEGLRLKDNWERHLHKLPGPHEVEPTPAQKKAKKANTVPTKTQPARRESQAKATTPKATSAASPTFALGPEGLPLIRRDSTTVDGRPKRSIHPPKNRDLPYSTKPKKKKFHWELKFCEEVMDELHKPKYYNFAAPFYQPVDPVALNIPTYHNIIKKPMDLSTIRTKLQTGQYENSREMENDVRLMFRNCYKFNIQGDPTYTAGKKLEEIFDTKWSQKARWLEAHDPASAHQSDTSENESSEEEDSGEDEQVEKLQLLQKQIAEMSKQVEAIRQKKKKTPPAVAKKSNKLKPGKKDTKKGASLKKDKKVKPTKPEKQRWITYREKQIISHGISTLPETKVQDALHIIQSNVPSLKVKFFSVLVVQFIC